MGIWRDDHGKYFAFRATDPDDMKAAIDQVGPENDEWLIKLSNYQIIKLSNYQIIK